MVQVSKHSKEKAIPELCCSNLARLLSPRLFKALSDPKRLSLFMRLLEDQGPSTVSQVAHGSGVDFSVVSRHLAVLREAGIISCAKRGKEVWCTVEVDAVAQILRDLAGALESCCPQGCSPRIAGAESPERKSAAQKKHVSRLKQPRPA